ncbi:MAG TPA: ribosome silencing factor, partial [Pantoea sp.]|nr:ribosome silencing factor [Pantoea sp.]
MRAAIAAGRYRLYRPRWPLSEISAHRAYIARAKACYTARLNFLAASSGPAAGPLLSVLKGNLLQGKALQEFVIDKIDDLKGQDIVALDVQGKSSITDCMIICTGTSTRHVSSIADHVVQESRA